MAIFPSLPVGAADPDLPGGAEPGSRPRFSVVLPAHNEERYLGHCLRSLAAQDFAGSFEVVVVDNCSTDASAKMAADFGAVVVAEPQLGVCWARQRGTLAATGEIIVSSDADTTFESDWLTRIDKTFAARPDSVAVAGPCRYLDGPWWATVYPRVLFGFVHLVYLLTGKVCYVTATNIAFRRSAWTTYDTRLTQGGDELDLLRRLQARGRVVFDLRNPTLTSARRLAPGLAYSVVVTFLYYYALAYMLNRAFRRPLLGAAPPFRGSVRRRRRGRRRGPVLFVVVFVVLLILFSHMSSHLPDLA